MEVKDFKWVKGENDYEYIQLLEEACKRKDAIISRAINKIKADRKTESSSKKPNNCEDLQDWKDRMWAEAVVTEPTTEDCSTVDKDINVRSKDEPQTEPTGYNLTPVEDEPQTRLCRECDDYAGDGMYCASNYIVHDFSTSKGNCEPQTEDDKKHCVFCKWVYEPNVCGRCRNMNLFADAIEDEPQTDCKTCRYGEVDEGYVRCAYYSKATEQDEPQTDCDKCQHRYDGTAEYCRTCGASNFQPKDEPHTERSSE